jgi:multimeric flavodoxin WrbA
MHVIALNGSPKKEGNTYQAIKMVCAQLEKNKITSEIIHVGGSSIRGCTGCNSCFKNKNEKCVVVDDNVNEWIALLKQADGFILGSPVHFSSLVPDLKAFLDRAFYVATANNSMFRHKVGVSVVAVRRSGGLTTFNELNQYLTYSEMLIPTSNYWNVIHGRVPGDVCQDEEGVQIMRILGKNMAWLMQLVEQGRGKVVEPERENKIYMSFIR